MIEKGEMLAEVPEDAFANASVHVVQYLDADGEMHYVIRDAGDAPLSTFLGLLELGKAGLVERFGKD